MHAFIFGIVYAACVTLTLAMGDTSHLCDHILVMDCAAYTQSDMDEKVCTTKNELYSNFCEFSQAKCADDSLEVASLGRCYGNLRMIIHTTLTTPYTTLTPPSTTTPINTMVDVFCLNKDSVRCPASIAPVCGSDEILYINKCNFFKAFCDDRSLNILDSDNCSD